MLPLFGERHNCVDRAVLEKLVHVFDRVIFRPAAALDVVVEKLLNSGLACTGLAHSSLSISFSFIICSPPAFFVNTLSQKETELSSPNGDYYQKENILAPDLAPIWHPHIMHAMNLRENYAFYGALTAIS